MPHTDPTTTPERRTRLRALTGMGALGLLSALLVLGAASIGPWQLDPWWNLDLPDHSRTDTPSPGPTPSQPPPIPSQAPEAKPASPVDLSWLGWVVAAVAAVALILLIIRIVFYWLRPRTTLPAPSENVAAEGEADVPTMREGVHQAENHLRAAGPPRDAIIAAWVAIEDAADRAGMPRRPAQTPTEHATAVLRRTGADAAPTQRLLRLYQRARFSAAEPTDQDVAAAAQALRHLSSSWPELAHGRPHGVRTAGRS